LESTIKDLTTQLEAKNEEISQHSKRLDNEKVSYQQKLQEFHDKTEKVKTPLEL